MGFPTTVQTNPAPAVEGDFASANPRANVLAGPGALVAGAGGVRVGRFAFVSGDGLTATSFGSGVGGVYGFVHRDMQALITTYLDEFGMVIPKGFGVTLHSDGDFWARNAGPNPTTVNGAVYIDYSDGSVKTALPTGFAATGSVGATFTGAAAGTALTTTAVTGVITPGDTIAGTGIPAGTTIVSQTSGTPGGAGVYVTSAATTSAGAATSFGNTLQVTAVGSGLLGVGDAITGTGIPANATIASQVSGATGGVGVYTLSAPATAYAASTALTGVDGVQTTAWKFKTIAAVGELVKISTWGR